MDMWPGWEIAPSMACLRRSRPGSGRLLRRSAKASRRGGVAGTGAPFLLEFVVKEGRDFSRYNLPVSRRIGRLGRAIRSTFSVLA
jgi:hypothetical protein